MVDYVIITDTSCLILLDKLQAFDLLNSIYSQVVTTPEVSAEFGNILPAWLKVLSVKDRDQIQVFLKDVDAGEASAIALAKEVENSLLILDDGKARKLAARLELKYIGTVGVFITARRQNKIGSLRPYFDLIRNTDFRIHPAILDRILEDFSD